MCTLHESEHHLLLCRGNNGSARVAAVCPHLIASAYDAEECCVTDRFPQETTVGSRVQNTQAHVLTHWVADSEEHFENRQEWPELRDPELSAAIDGIIAGIEKRLADSF